MPRTFRSRSRLPRLGIIPALASFALALACGGDSTGPGAPPGALSLAPGNSSTINNGQQIDLSGGATGGEYLLVVTDTLGVDGGPASSYRIAATGIGTAGSISAPATSLAPSSLNAALLGAPRPSTLDISFGARLNERARRRLVPLFSSARQARAARQAGVPGRSASVAASPPQVGDILTLNVSPDPCDTIENHPSRVMAVGTHAIVAVDTLNPSGGFSASDYTRFAADFDTLIYPLDVANFGEPTDIDQNGHVILLFTRAVNELTPPNQDFYVGGFFFERDLFPRANTPTLQGCAGSNLAEMFYLLAPDPSGAVNGNVRTAAFIDSLTTSLIGHEFQHLINASRRLYVNNADDFEVVWLNEGLSHIAEELLFYRESGLAPRSNLDASTIRSSTRARTAFNNDQVSNASRYIDYLSNPAKNSPIRLDDSLATRGATWDFLRYATDRKIGSSGDETTVWQALVNSSTNGVANLRSVFTSDLGGWLRDWSVSQYTDDVVPNERVEYTQPSWNWHSIFLALGSGIAYPLPVKTLPAAGDTGSLIPGSSVYYRFAVPANGLASLTVSGSSGAGVTQGVVVRLR
jgi:hypothetical protein